MKKSINYWSFEGGMKGEKPLAEAFREAREKGFEAVELCLAEAGELTPETTEKQCKVIKQKAQDAGVEIASVATGLYWKYSLTDDRDLVREKARIITRSLLERTAWMGVDAVLVVPGAVDIFFKPDSPVVPYDVVWDRSLEALEELAPLAESLKVAIGVENVWNKFLLSPLEMRSFVDEIKTDYVGVYFDVGNVLLFGYPEQWIRILGDRIKRVHIKDFKRSVGTAQGFSDLLEGDVNWPEVMKALGEIGYDGYITAEVMPWRPDLLEVTSKAMDKILGRP
jgi:hexulose-6-phosphate isomerase